MLVSKFKSISKAFGLNTYFNSRRRKQEVSVDYSIDPYNNRFYSFESGNEYQVELNSSGTYVSAPFKFFKSVKIQREELYDN